MSEAMDAKYEQAEALFKQEDYEAAISLYKELEAQGHMLATYSLGWCYENEAGFEKDYAKAIEKYTVAYNIGHARSAMQIGWCYKEGGFGIEQDHQRAIEWFEKAAERGKYNAYYEIGEIYVELNDPAKAKMAYEKGVENEDPDSYAGLGNWYLKYEGDNAWKHLDAVLECAKKSYDMGSLHGALLYFNCYTAAGVNYIGAFEAAKKLHEEVGFEEQLRKFAAKVCDEVEDIELLFTFSKKFYDGVPGISLGGESLKGLVKVLSKLDNDPSKAPFAADLVLHVATVHLDPGISLYNPTKAIGILEAAISTSYCTDAIRYLLAECYDRSDNAAHKLLAEDIMCMLASKREYEKAIEYCNARGWSQEKLDKARKAAYMAKGVCAYCGGEFKGFFKKTCIKCGKAKSY